MVTQHGELRLESDRKGTVTVEGDTIAEVTGPEAKTLALQVATSRLSKPGFSSQSGPYPVDPRTGQPIAVTTPEGELLDVVLPPGVKYRNDIAIQAAL